MGIDAPTGESLASRRVLAFAVDFVVVASAAWVAAGRIVRSRGWRALVTGAIAAPGGLVYHALLEGASGRTVGKAAAGIAVASADGESPTFTQAAVRTAFRLVDWLPAGYLLGFVAMALTDHGQRLGDVAAGTVVVREGETGSGGPDDETLPAVRAEPRQSRR